MALAKTYGDFSFGFDDELQNPGGAIGSQAGSQTGGSGAGLPGFDQLQTTPGGNVPGQLPGANQVPPWGTSGGWGGGNPMGPTGMPQLPNQEAQQPTAQPAAAGASTQPTATPFNALRSFQSTLSQLQASKDPAQQAQLGDQLSRSISQTLTAQGHDVKMGENGQLIVDGRPYSIAGAQPAGAQPQSWDQWSPSGQSGYTPGEIGMSDLPGFSYESLMSQMGGGQINDQTAALMSRILANPESLGQQQTDTMKAASKDELADLFTGDMARMKELGTAYGIQDSPWLAAAEGDARGRRNDALVSSNRNIEMEAARTNNQDRLNAAGAGMQYGQQRASQVQSAAQLALSKAAATGDRLQLRESVKQQAAQLGISSQQVLAQYLSSKFNDMTQRYGIDIGKDISMEQLAQADSHFTEELAMKMQELEQADAQFGARHDLDLRQQKLLEDRFTWDQERALAG